MKLIKHLTLIAIVVFLSNRYQRLLLAERECSQAIRDVEREIRSILDSRMREEQNIILTVRPLFPYPSLHSL